MAPVELHMEPAVPEKTQDNSTPAPAPSHVVPLLEEAEIAELAKGFADAIPEGEMSVRRPSMCFPHSFPGFISLDRLRHSRFPVSFSLLDSQLSIFAYLGRELARLPSEEQDAPARVCAGGCCLVSCLSIDAHLPGLISTFRVRQERETREKMKKEKEEVCALGGNCSLFCPRTDARA
jgi:hypothetical protein